MHSKPKKRAGEDIIIIFFCPKCPKKEIKRKNEYKRQHICSKGNTAKIDGPIRGGVQKSGDKSRPPGIPKFTGEKNHSQNCEGSKKNRPHFEGEDAYAEKLETDGNQIHKKSLPAVIVDIEKPIVAGFDGVDRIGAVHRFIRIDARRKRAQMIDPYKKTDRDNNESQNKIKIFVSEERPVQKTFKNRFERYFVFAPHTLVLYNK